MKEKPELAELILPKTQDLQHQFVDLERTTKDKGELLFDANREVLIHQTCDDIDSWMNDLEKQIESEDTGNDLASVNILMQKQQVSKLSTLLEKDKCQQHSPSVNFVLTRQVKTPCKCYLHNKKTKKIIIKKYLHMF